MAEPLSTEAADFLSLLRSGEAPREIRRFAARGLLPLDADDQIRALLWVLDDVETDTAETARATFAGTAHDVIARFLEETDPTGIELDTVARHSHDGQVLERVIRHRNVDDQTLLRLAGTVTGTPQDALVVNQVRLLRLPALIDALFANPELTAESRRRLNETREEFFEKDLRRKANERLRVEEAHRAAEAAEEADAAAEEAAEEAGDETPLSEEDAALSGAAFRRIAVMTVQEKINLAYSGGKEERRILVGDSNPLVGQAVLKSRGLTVNEVESFCGMRNLDSEIFRKIAANREWIRKLAVARAFVKNPAVPIALALPLVKMLPLRDLKAVMRDPNLAEGVRLTARKILEDKRH